MVRPQGGVSTVLLTLDGVCAVMQASHVTKRGTQKVMNFGLAKLTSATRVTETATIPGTLQQLSPEQAGASWRMQGRPSTCEEGIL